MKCRYVHVHVSWMYHVGMSRKVMLCTLTFAMTVSLGCIHDYVHSDDVHSAHHCQGRNKAHVPAIPSISEPGCSEFRRI
jgi:hypothetical protein